MASRAALLLASVLAVARATLPLPAFARHGASAGAPVAAAPADCCMYGGTGSGYSIGNMVFPFLGSDLPVIVTG